VGAYGHHYGDCRRELWRVERDVSLKRVVNMCIKGSVRETGGFLVRLELFAVIQTGTIAAVGVAFAKLPLLVCAFK
jgi:hypothetical protein